MAQNFPTISPPKGVKVYKGAFNFYHGGSIYSEETFEVFRERREQALEFVSEIHSRVSTGELLSIKTHYMVNKEFIPQKVYVDRSLGNKSIREEWIYNKKRDEITYIFREKLGVTEVQFPTSPKFHISTPTATTSMLFIRSKKFDTTGKNVYSLWQSNNEWNYEKKPENVFVNVKKISSTNESMNIEGQNVQAIHYRLFQNMNEDEEEEKYDGDPPLINVYLSKHLAIPYLLRSETDKTKVQIRYLNNLDSEIS